MRMSDWSSDVCSSDLNASQAETGADISVDDDGMMGTVTIGSVDKGAMDEAERQIKLILNPPTADVGATYKGRVVNITKFGAFVNKNGRASCREREGQYV